MNRIDPKLTALRFNECINRQDAAGLGELMAEDHLFVDRQGQSVAGKATVMEAWARFFALYLAYKNTFDKVVSRGGQVTLQGYAIWEPGGEPDPALWAATVDNDLLAEWRIDEDSEDNRRRLGLA